MGSLHLAHGTVIVGGERQRTDIVVVDGVIASIGEIEQRETRDERREAMNAGGLLAFPGLIDCHVHLREPGMGQKGTMQSETRAALAGGVTTVCDMPNTLPPTVTVAALGDKIRRAEKIVDCDIRFFFGITELAHLIAFKDLWTGSSEELVRLKERCCGVKLYLDHSTGNQKVHGSVIEDVFQTSAELGFPIVCHCEDPNVNAEARHELSGRRDVAAHSLLRPPASEVQAVAFAIGLLRSFGGKLHIAHLSTRGALDLVRQAKKDRLPITCEVAPHHLFLTVEDYAVLGTLGKMNPPLREAADRDALWAGIADGTIDCIATDHAPHTLEEKRSGNPLDAPSGVPGVETMLPLLLSVAAGHWPHPNQLPAISYQLSVSDIVRLCFENPNRIFSLGKEGIREGATADIILVDPNAEWTIEGEELHAKCQWTPYEEWEVCGRVVRVLA